jgi:CheY-like chemotaxis protein
MNLLTTVSPHLPFLRRYARALSGDQPRGDAFVRRSLELIAADPSRLDSRTATRVSVYAVFQRVWREADAGPSENSGTASRLMRITPASRQAFLLTGMEGFSIGETAIILDVGVEDVEQLLLSAQHEIERDIATDILIIEDEPVISTDLEALVTELGHQVCGISTTRAEARSASTRQAPGLVLADIQLADGSSGIDAAKDILENIDVPVIFITAFPERLLTGDRPEPAFLITKPFDPVTVKAAIGQALFFHPGRGSRDRL